MIPVLVTLANLKNPLNGFLDNLKSSALPPLRQHLFQWLPSTIAAAILFSVVNDHLHAQDEWLPIGDPSASVDYYSITYDGTQFFAAGEGSRYSFSSDGINWETRLIHGVLQQHFQVVRLKSSEKGLHIISRIGSSGSIAVPEDPTNWTIQDIISSRYFADVAYGNGLQVFIYSASSNLIFRIPDGSNNSIYEAKLPSSCISIAFGSGLFAACGNNGKIYTSTDGINWADQPTNTLSDLKRIIHTGNEFVAVGYDGALLRSSDGLSWDTLRIEGDERFFDIARYGDHYYILSHDESPVYRADLSGNLEDLKLLESRPSGIAASPDRIVLCGSTGSLIHSKDGEQWFDISPADGADSERFYAFLEGTGVVAMNDQRGFEFSNDLKTWHSSTIEGDFALPFTHQNRFFRRSYIDSKFYESADGIDWEIADGLPAPAGDITHFPSANGVLFAFNNALLVGVLGESNEWQLPNGNIEGIANTLRYEGDKFLLGKGDSTADYESVDGLTWTKRLSPDGQNFDSTYVAYKSAFYSFNDQGVIRSEDGTNWQAVDAELLAQYSGYFIRFFLAHETLYLSDGKGNLFWTLDGEAWSAHRVVNESRSSITQVIEFNEQVIAISSKGQIYSQSPAQTLSSNLNLRIENGLSPRLVTDRSDPYSRLVYHERSSDLKNWQRTLLKTEDEGLDPNPKNGESLVFHRAMTQAYAGIGGVWTGTLETVITGEGNCANEYPEKERVSYLLKLMPDNTVSLDQFQEGGQALYGIFRGTLDPNTFQVDLIRELNSECQAIENCDVSISGADEPGLEMVISWSEPVCGEQGCTYQRVLKLYR